MNTFKYFVVAAFRTPNVRMPSISFLSGHQILKGVREGENEFEVFNSFQYNEFLLQDRSYILLVDTSCMVVYQHTMDKQPIRFLGSFVTTMSIVCPFCGGLGTLNSVCSCSTEGTDYLPNIIERLNYSINNDLVANPFIGDIEYKQIDRNLF